ncbi:hypothetical protein [Nocardioides mesophilus]|uniref:Uncharacterized protein n=1 Tax=Nocardioides mesophilus TaxID=433659 RepID=A0A7G9R858_9ACTN|nr:hypothetical protein [Nocardioides mesophilus]QNN51783.1 hypothetical protein H9L09_14690 [Nocardioides mesophilus]
MEILLWLVPAAGVTVLAMLWAVWVGRPRREQAARSEADDERFARAILKQHPTGYRPRPAGPRDRSTGIAVRPSRRSAGADTRRSA